MSELKAAVLNEDGIEALRLADAEGLEHTAAAHLMGISRPTFSRLVSHARTTVATALTEGMALKIDGGGVDLVHACRPKTELNSQDCQQIRRRRGFCGRASVVSQDVGVMPEEGVDDA